MYTPEILGYQPEELSTTIKAIKNTAGNAATEFYFQFQIGERLNLNSSEASIFRRSYACYWILKYPYNIRLNKRAETLETLLETQSWILRLPSFVRRPICWIILENQANQMAYLEAKDLMDDFVEMGTGQQEFQHDPSLIKQATNMLSTIYFQEGITSEERQIKIEKYLASFRV